jgi:MYXO-CTERM domain-containing protein
LCEVAFGETCFTCLADCGCKDFKVCLKGVCESPDKLCTKDRQQLKCETGGTNCTLTCIDKQGCGCSQTGEPLSSVPWFVLLLFGMALTFRRRTARDV